MSQLTVLSRAEVSQLNQGRRRKVHIPAHNRMVLRRAPQVIKDNTIHNFVYTRLNQIERYDVTTADRRHARNLVRLLKVRRLV